jgi:ABC-type taurine transport system substrate-binding protein
MVDDPDTWRAANLLPARGRAARRGDVDGCAVWKRILAAVSELTRMTPAEGEQVN